MSKEINIVTAPEHKHFPKDSRKIFLAGGICKCIEWQKKVIDYLKDSPRCGKYDYILNPRRDNFVMAEGETVRQIEWEFDMIESCDIFTMYFAGGESDQPICMYELGRNIERMKQKYPRSWMNRIVITCDSTYKRVEDVRIQVELATEGKVKPDIVEGDEWSVQRHCKSIEDAICKVSVSENDEYCPIACIN